MSERKRYWEARLETNELRAAWFADLKKRHLFTEVAATDSQCRADEPRTLYLLGRRSVAVEEFAEASSVTPLLVAATFTEALTPPPPRQKREENGNADADQPDAG